MNPIAAMGAFCMALVLPCAARSADQPGPQGRLETTIGDYVFHATTCTIHAEDDILDIMIQGPGTAPDGDVFYLELQSLGASLDIALGVDGPFQSLDRHIRAGAYVSADFTVDATDGIVSISDLTLVDENGQVIDAQASLSVDCDAARRG